MKRSQPWQKPQLSRRRPFPFSPPASARVERSSMKPLITVVLVSTVWCSSAVAETTEERQACIGDAFRVCWAAIPNRNDVFHCLLDNRSRLTLACRMVMDQYRRPHRITRSARATHVE